MTPPSQRRCVGIDLLFSSNYIYITSSLHCSDPLHVLPVHLVHFWGSPLYNWLKVQTSVVPGPSEANSLGFVHNILHVFPFILCGDMTWCCFSNIWSDFFFITFHFLSPLFSSAELMARPGVEVTLSLQPAGKPSGGGSFIDLAFLVSLRAEIGAGMTCGLLWPCEKKSA